MGQFSGDHLPGAPDPVRELLLRDPDHHAPNVVGVVGEGEEVAHHSLPKRPEGRVGDGGVDLLESAGELG